MVGNSKIAKIISTFVLVMALLVVPGCAGFGTASNDVAVLADNGTPAVKHDGVPAERYVAPSGTDEAFAEESNAIGSSVAFSEGNLVVRFLDVGQGDAALISCNGQHLLIDGGPSKVSSKLYSILQRLDITHLDYIVASHPDADHCGGIAGALNYATCGTFYCSVAEHNTKTFNSILKYLGSTPVTIPSVGDSFSLGGATVSFVGPVQKTRDTNDGSLVCTITYGDRSFLFTGDAEETSEILMTNSGADIDVDVLKVGHHGSSSSSSMAFLNKVTPQIAVISVGSNSYGHPTQNVLDRLAAVHAEVLRTDEIGSIIMTTDGKGIDVESTKGTIER